MIRETWKKLSGDPPEPAGLSAVAGVLLFIPAWLKRFGTEIAVTDRRVIYKTGLVQRDTTEINMAKIESVDGEPINSRSGLWLRYAHHSRHRRDNKGSAEHSLAPSMPKRHHGSVSRCRD